MVKALLMADFNTLLKDIENNINKDRLFELFCKWFLENDPFWTTQIKKVWLWKDWPENWGRDKGIDLVFEHKNGEYWAVQSKCYSTNYYIKKGDVDKFLSESNRPQIKKRLLLASTNNIGPNALEVAKAQEKSVIFFLLKDFEQARLNYPEKFSKLLKTSQVKKPTPDPHQINAIKDVVLKFKEHDRGQLIMACGTGKTFTTLWIKERLNSKSTLVLVPSLNLLSQSLNEWVFASKKTIDVICICSDISVGKKDSEDISVLEAPFPVTNDVSEISKFFQDPGDKVVFCTYQSLNLIAKAQSKKMIATFDLVIADEAHRCAGSSDNSFSLILAEQEIISKKRLFVTATPRLFSSRVKKAGADRGIQVYDMDHIPSFGPVFHTLTFGEAISKGLLNDYAVVIVGVDDSMIKSWIDKRELVSPNLTVKRSLGNHPQDNLQVVSEFNEKNGILRHDQKIILLSDPFEAKFMGLNRAVELLHQTPQISEIELQSWEKIKREKIKVDISDAKTFAAKIGVLKAIKNYDLTRLISFHSRIQNAKKFASELSELTNFIDSNDQPDGPFYCSYVSGGMSASKRRSEIRKLKSLHNVKRGLLANARCLSEGIDVPALDGIAFIDPKNSQVEIVQAIGRVIRKDRASKKEKIGTIIIPVFVETGDDKESAIENSEFNPVWSVVKALRSHDDSLAHRLDAFRTSMGSRKKYLRTIDDRIIFDFPNIIGTDFSKKLTTVLVESTTSMWEYWYGLLLAYIDEVGNSAVPTDFLTANKEKLGVWCGVQRTKFFDGTLLQSRREKLDQVSFVWNLMDYAWDEGFNAILKYKQEFGNANCPKRHVTKDGFSLGIWSQAQRARMKQKKLEKLRIKKLEKIGFIWSPKDIEWQRGLPYLKKYYEKFNNSNVPATYKTSDSFSLGTWLHRNRKLIREGKLSRERLNILAPYQIEVDLLEVQWAKAFSLLQDFYEKYGHSKVSANYKTPDGFALGTWVMAQRSSARGKHAKSVSEERKRKLEKLDFIWDPIQHDWEQGLSSLEKFYKSNGIQRVPTKYVDGNHFKLGYWYGSLLRSIKSGKLEKNKFDQLKGLGFKHETLADEQFLEGIRQYREAKKETGNDEISSAYVTKEGFHIYQWMANQKKRFKSGKLKGSEIKQLKKEGIALESSEDSFNQNLRRLSDFVNEKGHGDIPQDYKTSDGFGLGYAISRLRKRGNDGKLSAIEMKRLNEVGFIWNVRDFRWQKAVSELKGYISEHKSALVPGKYISPLSGFNLGKWVNHRRNEYRLGKLTQKQIKDLDTIGFIWKLK